jgi:hypothetical protein
MRTLGMSEIGRHLHDGHPYHVLQLLNLLEADRQALKIVEYKRGWTLTYDVLTEILGCV